MADYSGSFSGSFQGTISGSLLGSGIVSGSTQIDFNNIANKPTTIQPFQANSIVSNNRFREVTFTAHSASVSTRLTTLDSSVDTLSAQITAAVSGTVPPGTISGSSQIAELGYLTSASAAAALGFGSGGGAATDISALNTFTASIQSEVNALIAATSSYLTSASAAALGFGGGGETYTAGLGITISNNVITLNTSSTHFIQGVSASAAASGFGGGGGSFGDPPVIDQSGLQIREYTGSGVFVGTLTVTDPTPGDTATWATQSGYSAGYFGISTGGNVTTLQSPSAAWNTAAGSGSNNAHPFLIQVTDGQNNTVTGTIYIYVLPNNAPVFRQTSVGGSIITSFTSSGVNENSTAGATVATIYFTDEEGDTITIGSGSWSYGDSTHFTITKNATNVVITQATSSLDYETYNHYQLYLTASDSKYPSPDSDSVTYLPVRIAVTDNLAPTLNDQSVTGVNENSANGASAGNITITDNEGDASATIVSMVLKSAYMNGVGTNVTASMGGTSLYDPHADAFTYSGITIVRRNGVYINSDVANRYDYTVGVQDAFNATINYGVVTIPIDDDSSSTIGGDGGTYYILETAVAGDNLTTNSNGYSSGDVTFSSAASQMWKVNTVPSGYVRFTGGSTSSTGSSVILEVDTDISGNLSFGQTVAIQITASETSFETTKQYRNHTLNITENKPYLVGFSNTSANLNTNGARPSNTLTTISFTEQQAGVGDTLNHNSFTFTNPSGQLTASRSSDTYLVSALTNLSGSTSYNFTASIRDSYGNIGTNSHSINILQAGTGSLTTNGTFYVIESAVSGNLIYTNTNGRTGTQGDLGVTYSPQYNSAAVQSFTSSNAMVHVKSNGNLSVAQNVSESVFTFNAGNPITSSITWRDQFGNVGGPTQISVNVAINNAPTVSIDSPSTNNHNTNLGVAGAQLATLTWGDVEGNALNVGSFSLSGAGASLLSSSYNGSNVFKITALNDLNAGTINYTASIKDIHGFRTGTYNDFFVIAQAGGGTISPSIFYIIESAESGSPITSDTDGLGSAATLSVGYSPNYGTQTAEQFRTFDSIVSVTSNGVLSVKDDISGSANQSGDNINATIFWLDQYGNEGTGSITVNITNNQNPTAVFSNQSLTAPVSSVGTNLVSVSLTDPEGLTPFSMSLSGLSAISMSAVPQNVGSSSYQLQNSVAIGTGCILFYTASVFDSYNQETQYKRSLTITSASAASPLWYLYTSEPGQYAEIDEATYLITYGDANDDGVTDAGYPFDNLTGGDIGQSSFTSSAYTGFGTDNNTLVASGSILGGSNVTPLISNLNHLNLGFMIVFPSSSEVGITPSSTTNALGGSTPNQYVLFADRPGTGALNDNPQTSYVRYFDLDSGTYPNSSATRFGVIFVGGGASNITYFLMASSGSTPTSTQ
jgi:VCBS repeat-containing protein